MPSRPRTEEEKARRSEEDRRRYQNDPELRARISTQAKLKRAADKAAGIKPKPRPPLTEEAKAKQAARMRERYWSNPEKFRESARESAKRQRKTAPEAVAARKRRSYEQNRESILERQAAYREQNREERRAAGRTRLDPVKNRAKVKAWREVNPDKKLAAKKRRRAREAGAPVVDFTAKQWRELLEEFDGRCAYCSNLATTQDHLTPFARGGSHTASNIVPACLRCNSRKGTRTMLEFLALGGAA